MGQLAGDRRYRRRELFSSAPSSSASRRRYPRLFLDVDWFVESNGCSTLGRGLEISPRGALLPVSCVGPLSVEVTLYVCLKARPKMFRARGTAITRRDRGWAISFRSVSTEDLHLLAMSLVDQYGIAAVPALERKYSKLLTLDPRHLRDSISAAVPR